MRAFKTADLLSILYRYIPTSVTVSVSDDLRVFETAFTHSSTNATPDYERLEFLGDAVCSAIITSYLFHRFGDEGEAFMSRLRSYLISGKVYGEVSRQAGLPGWLRLGDSCEHLRSRHDIQEDVFESFVGALFLTLGYPIAEAWVIGTFEEYMDVSEIVRRVTNPRERLTNFCIEMYGKRPRVEVNKNEDAFVAKVFHPCTGEMVSEGHCRTSTRAVGNACDSAIDLIMATGPRNDRPHHDARRSLSER